ncbi:OmpA family protein [Flavobacteriaceae bacterium]|nr:OmpA family protein [Flavobacteriaceae bacterium]
MALKSSNNSFFNKKNYYSSIIFIFFFNFLITAQNETNPWLFFVGTNAVDTFPTGGIGAGDLFEEFSNLDHWNIAPYPSTIGVKKYIDAGFSFGTRFSLNKITSYGEKIASDNYYNVDGVITYNLGKVFNSMSFMPFLEIGGGYVIFDEQGAGYFNLGAGIEYWFGEKKKTAIILESLYKNTGETYAIKHFQHMIGLAFLFGGEPDTDGDGILDKDDNCPEIPGLATFNGCPDTDGDGIQDSQDDCPQIPGLIQYNGCPDTDGDGIQDSEDKCPEVFGLIENEGCPKMTEKVKDRLEKIEQLILFETDQDILTEEALISLEEVYSILIQYPNLNIIVEGHTDDTGGVNYNQELSEKRVATVLLFLIKRGISSSKIKSAAYGETRPLRTNSTSEGRRYNRRVQFNINE